LRLVDAVIGTLSRLPYLGARIGVSVLLRTEKSRRYQKYWFECGGSLEYGDERIFSLPDTQRDPGGLQPGDFATQRPPWLFEVII
jgi:hypothetical protein